MNCTPLYDQAPPMRNLIPVCASVIYQTPGVIYLNIDPDVFKIRCRQCQEKTEHRCPLPKLKRRFRVGGKGRGSISSQTRRNVDSESPPVEEEEEEEDELEVEEIEEEEEEEEEEEVVVVEKDKKVDENEEKRKEEERKKNEGKKLAKTVPPEPADIPDHYCTCTCTPKEICDCEVYKPLNFTFELEVTGEFKPAYVPKAKKGKYQ